MDHPRPGLKLVDAADLDRGAFDFKGIDVVDPSGESLGAVEGFIIDVNQSRPFHVVVKGGHWYKHKHFLLPIGHVRLDRRVRRLTADVQQTRVERFPGFSLNEFEKLTDKDFDQLAYASAAACSDEVIDTSIAWERWTAYAYPGWWDTSYYRRDLASNDATGVTSRPTQSTAADRGRK